MHSSIFGIAISVVIFLVIAAVLVLPTKIIGKALNTIGSLFTFKKKSE